MLWLIRVTTHTYNKGIWFLGSRACLVVVERRKGIPPPSRSISMGASSSAVFLIPLPHVIPLSSSTTHIRYPGPYLSPFLLLRVSLCWFSSWWLYMGRTEASTWSVVCELLWPAASLLFLATIFQSFSWFSFLVVVVVVIKKKEKNPRVLCNQRIWNFTLNDIFFPFFCFCFFFSSSSISFYGSIVTIRFNFGP
jgi:hypothetical protein